MAFPAALFTPWAITVSALGLGFTTQGVKICVDTTVQRVVADVYRGRVFVLYDVLFNAVFVAATALAAMVLPLDGRSYVVLATASLWYLLIAYTVFRRWPPARPDSSSRAGGPSDPAGRSGEEGDQIRPGVDGEGVIRSGPTS
jgi:hypothetical protein